MKGRNFAKLINGKPVVDAKRKVSLFISAMDIGKGKSKVPGACAAALSAMRGIPNCTDARIHLGRAYIYNERKKEWVRYQTPEALRSEIVAFDRGGRFEPGEYELRPVSPSGQLKDKDQKYTRTDTNRSGAPKHPSKTPRKLHAAKGVRKRAQIGDLHA